jgi:hypothetical protein
MRAGVTKKAGKPRQRQRSRCGARSRRHDQPARRRAPTPRSSRYPHRKLTVHGFASRNQAQNEFRPTRWRQPAASQSQPPSELEQAWDHEHRALKEIPRAPGIVHRVGTTIDPGHQINAGAGTSRQLRTIPASTNNRREATAGNQGCPNRRQPTRRVRTRNDTRPGAGRSSMVNGTATAAPRVPRLARLDAAGRPTCGGACACPSSRGRASSRKPWT